MRPFFRGELKAVSAAVTAAMGGAADRETHLHLEDIKDQIAKVPGPKIAASSAATTDMPRGFDLLEEWQNQHTCRPDYQIPR